MLRLLSVLLLCVGCSATLREQTGGGPAEQSGPPIFVELREGYDDDRDLIAVEIVGADLVERDATRDEMRTFDAHLDRCATLSVQAHDRLREMTGGRSPKGSNARRSLRTVPNAQLTAAVVTGLYPSVEDVVDLRSGQALSLPAEIVKAASPVAWCGCGEHLAMRGVEPGGSEPGRLVVLHVPMMTLSWSVELGGAVEDIAWNDDCNSLAVLASVSRHGKGPLESLGAAIGHPVPYRTFTLIVFSLEMSKRSELLFDEEVKYGAGALRWGTHAVASVARLGQGGILSDKGR